MQPVASPATLAPAFTLAESPSPAPQVVPIYTLSNAVPERIESVYMTLPTDAVDTPNSVYAIQYVDPSGYIIGVYSTPLLAYPDGADTIVFLNWSRLGNDSAQLPLATQVFAPDAVRRVWTNIRLPELVLAPLSVVNLLSWRDNGGEGPNLDVSDAFITTTRNPGGSSGTTAVIPLPMLTPTDSSVTP
jgi:hypothetical protein